MNVGSETIGERSGSEVADILPDLPIAEIVEPAALMGLSFDNMGGNFSGVRGTNNEITVRHVLQTPRGYERRIQDDESNLDEYEFSERKMRRRKKQMKKHRRHKHKTRRKSKRKARRTHRANNYDSSDSSMSSLSDFDDFTSRSSQAKRRKSDLKRSEKNELRAQIAELKSMASEFLVAMNGRSKNGKDHVQLAAVKQTPSKEKHGAPRR